MNPPTVDPLEQLATPPEGMLRQAVGWVVWPLNLALLAVAVDLAVHGGEILAAAMVIAIALSVLVVSTWLAQAATRVSAAGSDEARGQRAHLIAAALATLGLLALACVVFAVVAFGRSLDAGLKASAGLLFGGADVLVVLALVLAYREQVAWLGAVESAAAILGGKVTCSWSAMRRWCETRIGTSGMPDELDAPRGHPAFVVAASIDGFEVALDISCIRAAPFGPTPGNGLAVWLAADTEAAASSAAAPAVGLARARLDALGFGLVVTASGFGAFAAPSMRSAVLRDRSRVDVLVDAAYELVDLAHLWGATGRGIDRDAPCVEDPRLVARRDVWGGAS